MGNYQTLVKQHHEILNILHKMSCILEEKDSSDHTVRAVNLYKLLIKLQSLLNSHLLLEDDYMYPVLREHPDARVRNVVNSFFAEIDGLKRTFSAYAGKWGSAESIANSYPVFVSETREIITALQNRINREEKDLFPAIIRITQPESSEKQRFNILSLSKWLLMIAGTLFVLESILVLTGIHCFCCEWTLPCFVPLLLFGLGIIFFSISSDAFKRKKGI